MLAPLTDVWSGYSLLRSLWKIPNLVASLKARGFHSAVLADWETLAGTEEFDRRMREVGLFPLLGVTRLWSLAGRPHEVRLVAVEPSGWHSLVNFTDWDGKAAPGMVVVLAASEERWWDGGLEALGSSVVVELEPHQQDWMTHLPPGWCWVPAVRVRCAAGGDSGALELLADIGGLPVDRGAKPLPLSPQDLWEPYREWPRTRLWSPQDAGSIFARREWKMPRLPGVEDENAALRDSAEEGLLKRYGATAHDDARQRLEYELDVISQLGFPGYFLMVADVVSWAKNEGIRVGPGRGSAAGSLVSYCLQITDVDPLKYGLVFERFLNPVRRTLPDIDLDFEDTRRGEVIQYLRRRHGSDQVAQIGTYGTLGARAALRDVARVRGIPGSQVSEVLKSVEWGIGDALAQHADRLKEVSLKAGLGHDWILQALRLEGLPRHRSTHAAGVIIAPGPLTDALFCHGAKDDGWVTDFDMTSLEQLGFVKLDVLGLRTLTTLVRMEQQLGWNQDRLQTIDEYDAKTLRLLGRGDTDGIFQLDGRGVKSLLRQMHPRSAEEIMLVVALYRPGPMDAIQDLLRRRAAHYVPAPDDPLESHLTETFGIMVYQEQLMAAVQSVAGFSLAEADLVRRAISKKDHAMLAREGERLMANMAARGFPRASAETFWDRIRAFGDYGFNKSHAASYGLLAYYLAYVKAHHPLEFWAAELSSHENADRLRELMIQAVSQGIVIRPPHVNKSRAEFSVEEGEIRAGLGVIRGIGWESARRLVRERDQGGRFGDVRDLSLRLNRLSAGRILESLEMAGALAGLGSAASAGSAQMSLFDAVSPDQEPIPQYGAAFGFGWPEADGPVYVRLDSGVTAEKWAEQARWLASRVAGSVPLAVILENGRALPAKGVGVRADWQALEAIKEMDGVQAAGRHVSLREHPGEHPGEHP